MSITDSQYTHKHCREASNLLATLGHVHWQRLPKLLLLCNNIHNVWSGCMQATFSYHGRFLFHVIIKVCCIARGGRVGPYLVSLPKLMHLGSHSPFEPFGLPLSWALWATIVFSWVTQWRPCYIGSRFELHGYSLFYTILSHDCQVMFTHNDCPWSLYYK